MKRKLKQAVANSVILSLIAASAAAGIPAGSASAASVSTPSILITELVPDSSNEGSYDGYEFVELYNSTDEPISLAGYKLQVSDSVKMLWEKELAGDIVIQPRETVVIWTQSSAIAKLNLTPDQFRTNYNLAQTELPDDRLHIVPQVSGLVNGGDTQKDIRVSLISPDGQDIVNATYFVGGVDDTFKDKGISFKQPDSGIAMIHNGGNQSATPGRIADEVPGTAPANLLAAGGEGNITLTWSTVEGASGYKIYSQNGLPAVTVAESTYSYTYTGLTNRTDYSFTLSTVYPDGRISPASAAVRGRAGIPVPPSILTGLQALPRDGAIRVSWNPSPEGDVIGYQIIQDGVKQPELVQGTSYVASGLTNGQPVTFAVYAVNQEGLESQPVQVTQKAQAAPPLLVTEMAPDTKNVDYKTGGTDAFEFVELYNTTSTPINLNGFALHYVAGSTIYKYPILEDKYVQPNEAFIIWFKNNNVLQVTLEHFNTAHGSAVTEEQVYTIFNSGMSNSSARGAQIVDPDQVVLSWATYQKADIGESISANFIPDRNNGTVSEERFSMPTNPGYLYPVQRIADPADTQPPDKPVDVQVVAGIGGVKVSWSDKLEQDVAYVQVYVNGTLNKKLLAPQSEAIIDGLENGVPVTIEISAIDTAGRESVRTSSIEAIPTANDLPSLLITEIVPDTWNTEPLEARDVYDAFEFIELYNPGTEPLDLNGHSVRFTQPEDSTKNWEWKFQKTTIVQPKQTLLFWVRPNGLGHLKPDGFNFSYYGFQEAKYAPEASIILGDGAGGLNNTGGIVEMVKPDGEVIVSASYSAGQYLERKGLTYAYPMFGGHTMRVAGMQQTATPGKVDASQFPAVSTGDKAAPAAPAGFQAAAGAGYATLSWEANKESDLAGYRLYMNGEFELTLPATQLSYTMPALAGEVSVKFELSAVDESGNESDRVEASAKPSYAVLTQEERKPSPANALTESRFNEVWKIGAKGPIIPGLVQGYIPQGMSYYADADREWMLMAAYHATEPSTLAVVDAKTGNLVKFVFLQDVNGSIYKGHAGGVAVSENNIWISSGRKMHRLPVQTLIDAQSGGFAPFADSFGVVTNSSFTAYEDGVLWVGEYSNPPSYTVNPTHTLQNRKGETQLSWIAGYRLDENDLMPASRPSFLEENIQKVIPDYVLSIGDKIQGVEFHGGEVLLTYNYGRPYNTIMRYEMPNVTDAATKHTEVTVGGATVPAWFLDGVNAAGSINVPTASENMFIRKENGEDYLYVNFESGANTMRWMSSYSMDRLLKLNLRMLRNGSGGSESDSSDSTIANESLKPAEQKLNASSIKPGAASVEVKLASGKTDLVIPVDIVGQMSNASLSVEQGGISVLISAGLLKEAAGLATGSDSGGQIRVKVEPALAPQDTQEMKAASEAFTFGLSVVNKDGKVQPVPLNQPLTIQIAVDNKRDARLLGLYAVAEDGSPAYAGGSVKNGVLTAEIASPGTYVVQEYKKSYSDVPDGHWAYDALQVLAAKHVIEGVSKEAFAPDAGVTRAEFTALLVRALGLKAKDEADFTDVPTAAWYHAAIRAAASNGLVEGVEPGRFDPDALVSREQMAVLLVRAWELKTGTAATGAASGFLDQAAISDWAASAVSKARQAGLLNGKDGNLFDPSSTATRAESAQAIFNALYMK